MSMTVYIVGPITGLKGPEVRKHFRARAQALQELGYTVLNPLAGKTWLDSEKEAVQASGYVHPISTDQAIYQRDRWMCHRADIIVADLRHAQSVSIGTCFELAWASDHGKKVIIVGLHEGHPMDHAFVKKAGSLFFATENEMLEYMRGFQEDLSY